MSDQVELYGLVLAGGESRRMGRNKADLLFGDRSVPQWKQAASLLEQVCGKVFLSIRDGQDLAGHGERDPVILADAGESAGPLSGILTAMNAHPDKAWLVVACDLPMLELSELEQLKRQRGAGEALAYRSSHDNLPEPLCAIYEPSMRAIMRQHVGEGRRCPRKILILESARVALFDLDRAEALENANTPEDFQRLNDKLTPAR